MTFRYSRVQRQLIFGLSSSHAVATLAVIIIGYNAGILDENILNGTIILILITCMVASFATERAAKEIVMKNEDGIPGIEAEKSLYNEHILLPIANMENIEKLLEFAILIKDKKSANPVSILSVVSNDDEAEKNILVARKRLEDFVKQASGMDTKINVITTIDYNAASGILRISREIMADLIVLGWPRKTGLIDKLIGEKLDSILSNTEKSVFICHIDKPMVIYKKIITLIPPLSEYEKGFEGSIKKMFQLSRELNIPVNVHCSSPSRRGIEIIIKKEKISSPVTFNQFNDWHDVFALARSISGEDMLVLISARKGPASYTSALQNLPGKMEKHFRDNSRIIVYP
jgi:nucleotide-binding universal stress UspA family protein